MANAVTGSSQAWTARQAFVMGVLLPVFAATGAIVLGAWIRIPLPFSPVPVTFQTLVIFIASVMLGPRRVTLAVMLYLACGLSGAPVFATPIGPTAGYLLGFLATPSIISRARKPVYGFLAAMAFIYMAGMLWLAVWLSIGVMNAFWIGVVPFLPGDAVKLLMAARLTRAGLFAPDDHPTGNRGEIR